MEKKVNEVVGRIIESVNFNTNDLNEIIELHKVVDKKQEERLDMVLRDKLLQINVYLSDYFLENLESMLFYRDGNADVVDVRIINKSEVVVIRNDSIELSDSFHDASELDAGLTLQEEAYLCEASKLGKEPDYCDPRLTFSSFYAKMENNINNLKVDLNIQDRNVKMYFDRDLDSFYFDNPKSFHAVLTKLPNIIEIYEIDATNDRWIPRRINGDYAEDLVWQIDFSILSTNFIINETKKSARYRNNIKKLNDIDIEIALDEFKNEPFNIENLIKTYRSLFENHNCMFEENESVITRLKYITTEKLVKLGFDYEKAFSYIELIFETIKSYKTQIINAINGENSFPNDSLIDVVKKIDYENNTALKGTITSEKTLNIIEEQGPVLKKKL